MGLFAALASGVSGLQTFGNAMGILADNITNVNTVGYKETRARFTTLVTESSSPNTYSPGGVGLVATTLVSKQGLLQASGSATDMSVDGAGFFVVRNSPNAEDTKGEILFTRAGSFTPDSEGFLKNSAGQFLMGWPVDSLGKIPANKESLTSLVPIRTAGLTGTASATTTVGIRANLQASQTINSAEATYAAGVAATNMASGTITPDFQKAIPVFDGQGGQHTMTFGFLKSSVTNQWRVEVYVSPSTEVTPGAGLVNGQLAVGNLAFNADGSIDLGNTSAALKAAMPITWTAPPGQANVPPASSITVDWGTDKKTDGMTQFDSLSTSIASKVNGAIFGNVTGVSVDTAGNVTALFDNGLSTTVFRLPVSTFQNPNGLNRRQGNAYGVSDFSGTLALVEAGTGGGGTIASGSLEASTVDLAGEFTQLITTQRAFSASTRIITTTDEMLDELNRIKR
jgi:flagellar hook protein FlgE